MGEGALSLPRFEWDAVKEKLVVRYTKQEAGIAGFGQSLLEFAPSRLELAFCALVGHPIQPGVLDQDIKAVKERPSGCIPAGVGLEIESDSTASSPVWSVGLKPKRESDLMHDYGGN